MGTVYRLALRQVTGKWRLIIMTVLATMPVVIATIMVNAREAPSLEEFETGVLGAMLLGSITPLVVLATITVAAPFMAASAFATSYIAYLGDMQAVFAVTLAAIIGVALYSAVFVFLGLVTTYAIG